MSAKATLMGAPPAYGWDDLPWQKAQQHVKRLQMRIAKAIRENRYGKVSALQRLLSRSFYGKCLAVRRVTQNKGKNTPGIDNVTWKTPDQKSQAIASLVHRGYKPLPLRRILIAKKESLTKMRPLSIPALRDRAMQSLWQLALEPVTEEWADRGNYGFRPKRSCQDALQHCFLALSRKVSASWIFEGDIAACFDRISHEWLEKNIPMDKTILRKFLKAGFMDKKTFYPTEEGTPQGGPISTNLMLMTLCGLETKLREAFPKGHKVNMISYADDFVVTGITKELLEEQVVPVIQEFLKERGLTLSQEKSKITHITQGFDFLGFNVRKYKTALIIKPSRDSVQRFLNAIRQLIKSNVGAKTEHLIYMLNLKIKGWAYYFRSSCASHTFKYIDNAIYQALTRWMQRRHANKSRTWIVRKYFRTNRFRRWQFYAKIQTKQGEANLDLIYMCSIPIRRHIKIKGLAHPYDPQYKAYFHARESKPKTVRAQGSCPLYDSELKYPDIQTIYLSKT